MTDFTTPMGIVHGPLISNATGRGGIARATEGIAIAGWSTDPNNYEEESTYIQLAAIKHAGPEVGEVLTLPFPVPDLDDLWMTDVVSWDDGQVLVVAETGDFGESSAGRAFFVGLATLNAATLEITFEWLFDHSIRDYDRGAYVASWPEQGWLLIGHNNGEFSSPPSFDNCWVMGFEVPTGAIVFSMKTPGGYNNYTYSTDIYGIVLNPGLARLLLLGEWYPNTSTTRYPAAWEIDLLAATPTWSDEGFEEVTSPRWIQGVPVPETNGWQVLVGLSTNGLYAFYNVFNILAPEWTGGTTTLSGQAYGNTSAGGDPPWHTGMARDEFAGKTVMAYRNRVTPELVFATAEEGTEFTEESVPATGFTYADVVKIAAVAAEEYIYLIGGYGLFPPNPTLSEYAWGTLAVGAQAVDPEAPIELPNRQIASQRTLRPVRRT